MYGFYLRNTCIGQIIRNTLDQKFCEMYLNHVAKQLLTQNDAYCWITMTFWWRRYDGRYVWVQFCI